MNTDVPRAALILGQFYSRIRDMRGYFLDLLVSPENKEIKLLDDSDSEAYSNLLNLTYIGVKEVSNKKCRNYPPILDMREVLDQAQERLFNGSKRPQNILTSGYRLASNMGEPGKRGLRRVGITNYFTNTTITAFQAPEWETLLLRIGEEAMIHLLTETSIFLPLPNGCFCQLTGDPVIFSTCAPRAPVSGLAPGCKRPSTEEDNSLCRKRRKVEALAPQSKTTKTPSSFSSTPADIKISRGRIFYSRPNFIPHTRQVIVGLPLRHVLNRLVPCYQHRVQRSNEKAESNIEEGMARHLSKYVFARQYGLNTPFLSSTPKNSPYSLDDYLDRESEIKALGSFKTPKRLKHILSPLATLIRRHSRCRYVRLRDRCCPSKIQDSKDLDSSMILDLMSETSIQLRSQPPLGSGNTSIDSSGNKIKPLGDTQAKNHAIQKPRFAEFVCSHFEVYRYIALVTHSVIPKSFWGSKSNLKLVLRYVKEFIACRRYETLTLHYILQKYSTASCEWLTPPGACQQIRVPVSDALKRRELLEDFLFWYFDSFVLPLIKTTFYVTESSAFRNRILYFRHDDWAVLCAPLIERLSSSTFQKISDDEASEILRQRKLGYSFIRLLPKETGVRPIVNLRRKAAVNRGSFTAGQSINQILQAAFSILTYERTNQPELLGASVFGPDSIYVKLKDLKASLPRDANGALPKLYFVKVDVQACFDTIEQTKLLEILRELISEDAYVMQKYGQISMSLGKVKRFFLKKSVPEDEHPHFLHQAADLAQVLRNTIFVDQVVYPLSKKEEVLQLLEEHITDNLVKIGQSYHRQTVGIPQGSVLSSILCSFFYGNLEKKFSKFTADSQSALLRLIDDYLFITTSRTSAIGFLDMMNKGHPEYGCFISQDKTLTNFDYVDHLLNVIDSSKRTFPWCGYSINMKDLSVTVDYSRYQGSGIRSTLTVDRGRKSGAIFKYKMLQLAKAKTHVIFSDVDLNTEHVIYLNIYQNYLLTAMKMHEYIRSWGCREHLNNSFLRNVIQTATVYNYTTLRAQTRKKFKGDPKRSEIRKDSVIWLGNHAFRHVLSRKAQQYRSLVLWLSLEMKHIKYSNYDRRFKALVKEGQLGVCQVL